MVQSSSADITEKTSLLEAAERRLTEELSAVRASLNDLKPVSQLPTEVLEEIFGICVSWLFGHQKPKYRFAWTQVCRRWRRISLNSARLWQYIDICDSRLAHEFLVRSGTAPISIVSASPLKLCSENLESHAERLQSIDVYLFPDDMVDLFTSIGHNLSNLQSLSLKVPPVSGNFILDIHTPLTRVSSLALDCVAIPWHTVRDLMRLSLRGLGSGYSPSLSQLYTIFESSPRLEFIRIESVDITDHDIPPTMVSLPYLRDLTLSAKAPTILSILSQLSFPHTTRLHINCHTFDSLRSILPIDHFRNYTSNSEIGTIRLARCALRFLRSEATPWTIEPSDTQISLGSSSSKLPTSLLPDIQSLFELSRVTALELSQDILSEIPSNVLVSFLAQATNLEHLRVAYNDLAALLDVLSSPQPSTEPHEVSLTNTMPCPRLRTILFTRPGDIWWNFKEQWVPPLLALAKARHASEVPLEVLEFRQCHGISLQRISDLFSGLVGGVCVAENVSVGAAAVRRAVPTFMF
ncbi:hypothetical protein Hypma_013612 [Hypsizygus marmoreus]|uniref:F-box domain-containing protein n=1 Tax=Hypsizygus marmoreus TaxID=39966 RepID=A0A369JKM0_HYPMA|nr:hypothetical protein Hypma_013612 [Hypsizygus marmoreus]